VGGGGWEGWGPACWQASLRALRCPPRLQLVYSRAIALSRSSACTFSTRRPATRCPQVADGSTTQLAPANARWPKLAPGGLFPTFQGAVTPAFSPDGRWVAFCDQAGPGGTYQIFRVRVDGRRRSRVTRGGGRRGGAVEHITLAWAPAA
jgi:hypothetical protein